MHRPAPWATVALICGPFSKSDKPSVYIISPPQQKTWIPSHLPSPSQSKTLPLLNLFNLLTLLSRFPKRKSPESSGGAPAINTFPAENMNDQTWKARKQWLSLILPTRKKYQASSQSTYLFHPTHLDEMIPYVLEPPPGHTRPMSALWNSTDFGLVILDSGAKLSRMRLYGGAAGSSQEGKRFNRGNNRRVLSECLMREVNSNNLWRVNIPI